MDRMFYGCSSLTSLDMSSFDTSKVTNMSEMFHYCRKLRTITVSNSFKVASNNPVMFYRCGTDKLTYK
jgi:surface protein